MTKEKVIEKLIELVSGELSPEEWIQWFSDHNTSIESICGRLRFLKIKPKESFSDIRNVYLSQYGAYEWLKSLEIDVPLSDIYKKKWEKEFDDFVRVENKKSKDQKKIVEKQFKYLQPVYPKFYRQLAKSYSQGSVIKKGKNRQEIDKKLNGLGLSCPDDFFQFFMHISELRFEGIDINFSRIHLHKFEKMDLIVLGEFWLYGDGDQLLYDPKDGILYCYAHEYRPPQLIKISDSINGLMENIFVRYLKDKE